MTDTRPMRGVFWRLYERLAMVVGLGALALVCLMWLPFALVLNMLLPRSIGRPVGRRLIAFGLRLYLGLLRLFCACRFDLAALDNLRSEGPLIIAANHPSLLDAVLILSRLPDAVCVMKASLMDNILFGAAARLAGYIRNNAPLEMILGARAELDRGAKLVIFPEGTRTTDFPLNPCQPAIGLIANRAGVSVQLLLIEFSTPYLGKAWPLFRRPDLPLRCRVRLGRRLAPTKNVAAFTQELEEALRQALTDTPPPSAAA